MERAGKIEKIDGELVIVFSDKLIEALGIESGDCLEFVKVQKDQKAEIVLRKKKHGSEQG